VTALIAPPFKRSHGRTETDILFHGVMPSNAYVMPGSALLEGGVALTTKTRTYAMFTAALFVVFVGVLGVLVFGGAPTLAALSALDLALMTCVLLAQCLFYWKICGRLWRWDQLRFDFDRHVLDIIEHRPLTKSSSTQLPLSSATIIETDLYGCVVNAFASTSRSTKLIPCALLMISYSEKNLCYLLWASPVGAPLDRSRIHSLYEGLAVATEADTDFECARIDPLRRRFSAVQRSN